MRRRHCRCKHIYAVQYVRQRELSADGVETVTESVTLTQTRKTYPQDWPNYNAAQTNEKRHFQELLADLCKTIEAPAQDMSKGGRPRLPVRRCDLRRRVQSVFDDEPPPVHKRPVRRADKGAHFMRPTFQQRLEGMENPETYAILLSMIEQTSLPLRSVESNFAVDSTGFTACRFVRWYDVKYNRFTSEQQWVKAHICCGVKTNVVTSIEIHDKNAHDGPILPSLVESTAKRFTMKEVSADKGYSGLDSHNAIAKVGAVPYIAFKGNTTGSAGGLFRKMFHFFQFKKEEFLAHYHQPEQRRIDRDDD